MITDTANIHDDLCGQGFDQRAVEMGNHAHAGSRAGRAGQAATRPSWWLAILFWALLALPARAGEPWVLLPEPSFMAHKATIAIPDAKSTVLAVAQMGEFGPEFPTAEQWAALGLTDVEVLAAARLAASQWLKQLKPEVVRGANKVVDYVKLSSDKIPTCAVVLAPEFSEQFEELLGPKPLVVMPNRDTVYVFPSLAGKHEKFAAMILKAWHSQAPRVSLEVFAVDEKGLRAVGVFEE